MDEDQIIRRATRRLLFKEERPGKQLIPGAGRSAAEVPEKHTRVKVTINLDGDVVNYFKQQATNTGKPYQSLINDVLHDYINGSRPEQLARVVREMLIEDTEFIDKMASKLIAK